MERGQEKGERPSPGARMVHVISPTHGGLHVDLGEIWQFRELFWFLVWRDIKVLYKQALLGVGWAVLVPFANAIIFAVIFGRMANVDTDEIPSVAFYMAGMVIWRYFADGLQKTTISLVGSQDLLTKVYFPRLIIPMAKILVGTANFLIALGALVVVMLLYHIVPAWTSPLIVLPFIIASGTAFGIGLFLSSLNVKYRDVGQMIPFITQFWMYVSVVLPVSEIPETFQVGAWTIPHLRYIYCLNPMAGAVECFRWCLCHHAMAADVAPPWAYLAMGLPALFVLLALGLFYFKRTERMFADIV